MNKMKAVGLGVGLAALMVVGLACGNGGTPASPPQAEDQSTVGPSGEPAEDTSPVIPGGTPLASLTYEGVVYYQNPWAERQQSSTRTTLSSWGPPPNQTRSPPAAVRA